MVFQIIILYYQLSVKNDYFNLTVARIQIISVVLNNLFFLLFLPIVFTLYILCSNLVLFTLHIAFRFRIDYCDGLGICSPNSDSSIYKSRYNAVLEAFLSLKITAILSVGQTCLSTTRYCEFYQRKERDEQ